MSIAAAGGLALSALIIHAQDTKLPSFDAASVKPHPPGDRTNLMVPTVLPGGRFVSRFSVSSVISFAYKLPINPSPRLSGVPDWARGLNEMYDIDARGVMPAGLSMEGSTDRIRLMVQALLADRFKLSIHRESKEMPVYELVVEKGGAKLQPADIQEKDCPETSTTMPASHSATPSMPEVCHTFNGGQGRGLRGRAVDVADLVSNVENSTGRPLLDKTGIKGLYRIETKPWMPPGFTQAIPPGAKAEDGS
ncbi:MAG TPA: TIGR03435 family protein, partial [Bryobacteraceae bacterium]|nr:TIGR03435 family protein [Bryobacteraceae bacterium]